MELTSLIGKEAKTIIVAQNQGTSEQVVIEVDVVISEDQKYENDLSSFPIEKGFEISDNVVRQPDSITMTVFISDSPINQLGKTLRGAGRTQTVYENFVRIAGRTKLSIADFDQSDYLIDSSLFICTLYTTHRIYQDMFLKSLSIPKNADSGDGLEFTADFVRIHFVDEMTGSGNNNTKNVNGAPRTSKQAAKSKPTGKTSTGTENRQSILRKGQLAILRFFK